MDITSPLTETLSQGTQILFHVQSDTLALSQFNSELANKPDFVILNHW